MSTAAAPVNDVVERIENAGPLDPVVKAVRSVVNKALGPQAVRDALHGVWLGHPLHPMLTDVPIGAWTSAAVLDLIPGSDSAASALIATGLAGAAPTAVAGWADWSQLHPQQQRVGIVHAAANITAVALYGASLVARRRGHRLRGKLLAYAGFGIVSAGGYLGGHLSYRQAAGANHTAEVPDRFPAGWQSVGPADEFAEGRPVARTVAGVELLCVRRGETVHVLSGTCSHLAGPLAEGEVVYDGGTACIKCPWHGSVFRLADGDVVHGPATSPQHRFETRVVAGTLEVRLPQPG